MKKTQDDELKLVILVLKAKEKTLTFKVRASLDVSCPKLHKVSKLQDLRKLHKVSKLQDLRKLHKVSINSPTFTSSPSSPSSPSSISSSLAPQPPQAPQAFH
jgi:hypothetical protein